MIATLPMYDFAHLRHAHDRFWDLIRNSLGFGPQRLTRGADLWDMWQSPGLILGQTCGMPFRERLHRHVSYVLTPDYGIAGCPPGYYNSVILSAKPIDQITSLNGATIAYNEAMSQSGWSAPINYLSKYDVRPAQGIQTGAHVKSMSAVAMGYADFCAVDAQTFALSKTETADFETLHIVAHTDPTPGLPYICAPRFNTVDIQTAITTAFKDLEPDHKAALRLKGFVRLSVANYLAIHSPTSPEKLFN